jgi:hypothetical protein
LTILKVYLWLLVASSGDSATVLGSLLVQLVLGLAGSLLGVLQVVLSLAELAQVDGGNFLSLLDLSLVDLQLVLQLVDQILETSLVLAVLLGLEGQLLEAAVVLSHLLDGLLMVSLLQV